jgi:hypothetical protein
MNSLQRLHAEQDQSPWIDFIDRTLIDEGKLAELVENGIRADQQPDHLRESRVHRPVRRPSEAHAR